MELVSFMNPIYKSLQSGNFYQKPVNRIFLIILGLFTSFKKNQKRYLRANGQYNKTKVSGN